MKFSDHFTWQQQVAFLEKKGYDVRMESETRIYHGRHRDDCEPYTFEAAVVYKDGVPATPLKQIHRKHGSVERVFDMVFAESLLDLLSKQ